MKLLPDNLDKHKLYVILKNVPSEALKLIINGDLIDFCSMLEDVEMIAIATIGTMLHYLSEQEEPATVTFINSSNKVRIHIYHDGTGFEYARDHISDNLLEALADACQKIGQET